MPRLLTMATLATRCKQRTDQEYSGHIADSEWYSLISEQYGDLYGIVAGAGLRYFETTDTITTDGSASYAEPSDMLSFVTVERVNSDGTRYELTEAMIQEAPYLAGRTGDAAFYTLVDDAIHLHPTPPTGQTYVVRYIPQPIDLSESNSDDSVDVVTPDGEAFLIWGVAVKALAKSESNVQLAIAEREAARARLTEWAQLRAFTQPRRRVIVDDYDGGMLDPGDWRFR